MLSDSLNTNQIKNAAGTEVEFEILERNGRTAEFRSVTELPHLRHRMKIQHREVGSGIKTVRESNIRFDKESISGVDSVTKLTHSCSCTLRYPIGGSVSNAEAAAIIANMISFLASLGATTTILYDGTGSGAKALLDGSL